MITEKDFPILQNFPPVKAKKLFKSKSREVFSAINKAEEFVFEKGYSIGSMCRDEPIALAKKAGYIAKWDNIDPAEYSRIEGLLLSTNFREGDVLLVEF